MPAKLCLWLRNDVLAVRFLIRVPCRARLPSPSESSNFFYGVAMIPDEGQGLFGSTVRKLL